MLPTNSTYFSTTSRWWIYSRNDYGWFLIGLPIFGFSLNLTKLTRRNISTQLNDIEIVSHKLIRSHIDHQVQIRVPASHWNVQSCQSKPWLHDETVVAMIGITDIYIGSLPVPPYHYWWINVVMFVINTAPNPPMNLSLVTVQDTATALWG